MSVKAEYAISIMLSTKLVEKLSALDQVQVIEVMELNTGLLERL